ncbi:4Fe-4S binding protein [Faecalicatena acetigenes]|uniref:4Fe-4S binding protein n=1 Tax=Faecalicatena acetigenes TaxID=2981790 RepID=A0ABT2T922_9FIRM|nr:MULTISPECIES: 4Fe-4S binding protein [Lachnospiraceae]MCU6746397.1 4Fe-4S binding protein [Faecalicatena acetigenes]SCH16211.1 NADH dehydrogenase subunit I [uncultured Clostridium sp.]
MSQVKIEPMYCKGCGYCIDVCPFQLLRIGSRTNAIGLHAAEQIETDKCTACKLCANICPESAITVYK